MCEVLPCRDCAVKEDSSLNDNVQRIGRMRYGPWRMCGGVFNPRLSRYLYRDRAQAGRYRRELRPTSVRCEEP